jgi:hypothetical protein
MGMGEEKSSKAEKPPTDGKVSPKEIVRPEIGTSITSPGEIGRLAGAETTRYKGNSGFSFLNLP